MYTIRQSFKSITLRFAVRILSNGVENSYGKELLVNIGSNTICTNKYSKSNTFAKMVLDPIFTNTYYS